MRLSPPTLLAAGAQLSAPLAVAALLSAPPAACAAPARYAVVAPRTAAPGPRRVSRDIRDYVQPGLRDVTVTLKTGRYDAQAGEKISKEFGMLYKLSGNGTFHYLGPDLIRLDGKVCGLSGALIMDGFTQRIRIGPIHQDRDQSRSPGKVTTLLDVGLLNAFYLSYTDAVFQGVQPIDGTPCAVFRLSYPARLQDTSFRLIWLDPATRLIRRREEHGQDGAPRAVYVYRRPVLVSGVWLPTEIDAANALGQFVGQTFLASARRNAGLTPDLFH